MNGRKVLAFLAEFGIVVLIFVVVVSAIAAPVYVVQRTAEQTRTLVEDHAGQTELVLEILERVRTENEIRAERTRLAVAALVEGLSCVLLIEPDQRTEENVDECIGGALREQGFG